MNLKTKPILGMIHLGGDIIDRAIEELYIYEDYKLAGCIIENYHAGWFGVIDVLEEIKNHHSHLNINIGVNILPNEFGNAFDACHYFNGSFIQMDYISGTYNKDTYLNVDEYSNKRVQYPKIQVLGGVWPKYYTPKANSSLLTDLNTAVNRCDAIVVTGSGTGKETPLDKIKNFRKIIGDFPLIVGAGLTKDNVVEQLTVADGGIVGSAFKLNGNTQEVVRRELVEEFMDRVKSIL